MIQVPARDNCRVMTSNGLLEGKREQNVRVWRGIPYARPPVGSLRWRAPQPPAQWQGVKQAYAYGPASWQDEEYCRELGGGDPGSFSEDCLYLNVWAPATAPAHPLPVMVWLHGGGFTIGAGGLPPYEGHGLTQRGVILVTVNYRLGHLGIFAHPALDGEDSRGPVHNFALLDQIAALGWVRDNIASFGGDPHKVTLFGESAGARSVMSLMASPLARGLFQRAIIQSGYTLPDTPRPDALQSGEQVAAALGLKHATAEQLRALPGDSFWSLAAPYSPAPVPVSGDIVLPEPVLDCFMAGQQHVLPVLVGSNSDEASVLSVFGVDAAQQIRQMRKTHRGGLALIRTLYPHALRDDVLGREVCRDMAFTTLGQIISDAQKRVGQPCWRYWFDYVSDGERESLPFGAAHGNEVAYVFDTLATVITTTEPDRKVAAILADYWAAFACHENSTGHVLAGPVAWPAQGVLQIGLRRRFGFRHRRWFMPLRLRLFKRVMKHHVNLD
ncbi:carboxylesterase/lipase family protein [Mangrovibacter yixingensis]|uniref:carboxylesterase/lipase family protein n=1 Tax=Mangrovibacter yixingensis TaxID=1529639 RepID=UPI00384B3B8E